MQTSIHGTCRGYSAYADAGMSKEDMLKQAKDRKKIAKANLNLKK